MKKSTRNIIIAIGSLSIASGIYGIITKDDLSSILFAFFIGASLIGSVFFDQSGNPPK